MISFIILITLCTAASCSKHHHSAAHSLRTGSHSHKYARFSSPSAYKRPSPIDMFPNPEDKDDMVFVFLADSGKRAEKIYPYGLQPISNKFSESNDFEQYAYKPREMYALVDPYEYPKHTFNEALRPYQKDLASNPIYSANYKISTRHEMDRKIPSVPSTFSQYVAQKQMPNINYRNGPIDMTYLSLEGPSLSNAKKVVPQWSLFPEKIEYIIRVLKKNMEITSSNVKVQFAKMHPPWVHYTLLITVCLELIKDVVAKGEEAYELDFEQNIIESVNKVTANPQAVAEDIKRSIDKTSHYITPILRFIIKVIQSESCYIGVECDAIIEQALTQTSNLQLKLQAILLQATIKLSDIFMNHHAKTFELAAKEQRAFEYVFNVDSRDLAPLVTAGVTVNMIKKYLNPTDMSKLAV